MRDNSLNLCQFCKQDVIRDCKPTPSQTCFMSPITRLAAIGEQAGFSCEVMIDMLRDGMSFAELLGVIENATSSKLGQTVPVV